ncbi:MAG: acetyl-CoA carboxylase biotin carboxyl carrier protein [Lachnospiraceae bacterium]
MEFENLLKLIAAVSDSNLTQFAYEENGTVVKIRTDKEKKIMTINDRPLQELTSAESVQNLATNALRQELDEGQVVEAPLVGTFYHSQTPEGEPFVKVGDTVKKGQVLGIIEAMKLMNEIESDYDGVVKKILVSNEAVVEFGQPMFVIA